MFRIFAVALLLNSLTLHAEIFAKQTLDQEYAPVTLIRKPFPAIKSVKHYAANSPKIKVADDELVLGLDLGEQSRAYPVNMLKGPSREIINDQLAGQSIAATW